MYIVAEMSANHDQDFDKAVKLVKEAERAGADAVKLQTAKPESLTLDSDRPEFRLSKGTLWEGETLIDLYQKSCMPWDWQPRLKALADELGLDCFSSPFDRTAVDFLEEMNVPAYKVASFELVDLRLIEYVAAQGKPVILSTGLSTLGEISDAVQAAQGAGATQIALLKCNSAYPAPPEDMNLRTIRHMAETFDVPIGLSDHTLGSTVPIASVALGAAIVEKHFTLSRDIPSLDAAFSMEPEEFREMVDSIRTVEKSLGRITYEPTEREESSRVFRRSLFVVRDMKEGEPFTAANVRAIRPGAGLPPKFLNDVLGRRAATDLKEGTPLEWHLVG